MIHIPIDRESPVSLARQVCACLRESILNGTLTQGDRLPSTREMAKNLNVARNVVIECYEQLAAEGYVTMRGGSGTYVTEGVSFETAAAARGAEAANKVSVPMKPDVVSFRTGVPDLASIPLEKWGKLYRDIAASAAHEKMDYQSPFGERELREQLSTYLRRVRGVRADPDNILITNGAAQAFSLLSQFVPAGGTALVENPLSHGILHTLQGNNVRVATVPVDESGMMTSMLPPDAPQLIFTTPSHQFPTGVVLPVRRRIEMIQYAQKHGAFIVEDDYDSEFRFGGSPIESLQQLAPDQVVYVGTFSKTLMPALRIGYMALPGALRERMEEAKYIADLHSPVLEQLTLAKFLESGLFDRHIRKMRKLYLARRNRLIQCLSDAFGNEAAVSGADAGMHLVATFRNLRFDGALLQKIEEHGLSISAVGRHYLRSDGGGREETPYDGSLIFGYGNTSLERIEEGVRRLREALGPFLPGIS